MYNKFPHLLNNIYQTGWFLCPISKYIGRGISHCLIAVTYAGIWRSIRQQFLACVFREPQPWEIGTQKPKLNRCRCRKLKIYIHYFCGPSLGSEFPFIYDCLCPQMFFLFSYIFFLMCFAVSRVSFRFISSLLCQLVHPSSLYVWVGI